MLSCHIDPYAAFLKDLQIDGCEVHRYRGPNMFGGIIGAVMTPLPTWWWTENVYFLAGITPGLAKRASDSDVKKRGMFTLDFDIRKELEKEGKTVTRQEIQLAAETILEQLDNDPQWRQFRYAVLSGNGLHVHYFGTPCVVAKDKWAAGMKTIFTGLNEWLDIPCDTGCGNAGRIMRLPGSWNVKNPAMRLPVDFLVWNPGMSWGNMAEIQNIGEAAIAEQEKKKEAEKADFAAAHPEGGSSVIDLINSIPIEQVVSQLFPGMKVSQVKKDGGMRFSDEKGVERGFFRHATYNIVVHEGTSLFTPPVGKGYNCLGLVKAVLDYSAHEAVQWFCERSAAVREAQAAEKEAWAKENAAKEVVFFERSLSDMPQ